MRISQVMGTFIALFVFAHYCFPAAAQEKWLSLAEKHRTFLEAGEIKVIPHENSDVGGTGLAFVKSPPAQIWQVITDYPEYSQFMPRNLYSKIIRREDSIVIFKTRYASAYPFPPIENESRITHSTHESNFLTMTWDAEKTNLEFNRGFWHIISAPSLAPYSLVVYQTRFSIPWVPGKLAGSSSRKVLVETMKAVRTRSTQGLPRYAHDTLRFAWDD